MKINRNSLVMILLTIIISFLMILLPGCGSSSDKATYTLDTTWHESSDGSIDTWDAERLQKIVSFKIIFPTYLPDDLKTYPPHLIKLTGVNSETEIRIIYQSSTGPGDVSIFEVNLVKGWGPNEDAEYSYLDITGVKVLEQKWIDYVEKSGKQVMQNKLDYMWNQGSISFFIEVIDYDQTVARKIVESMINQ